MEGNRSSFLTIPLSTIGVIVGVVLCVLQGIGKIDIGWFWATFSFWIVPAVSVSIVIVMMVIALLIAVLRRDR